MQHARSPKQQMETLEYLGDMLEQMAGMAAVDQHRLLSHLLYVASMEVEELQRLRRITASDEQADHAA